MLRQWTISFEDDNGENGVFITGEKIDKSEIVDDIIYVNDVKIQFNGYIKKIEDITE